MCTFYAVTAGAPRTVTRTGPSSPWHHASRPAIASPRPAWNCSTPRASAAITTNHIATHLGISPGNLYYHYPNKQAIIAELFAEYESHVESFLRLPEGRGLTVDDKTFYLEALLAAMWRYRFLHRDLEHLLESDPELAARYRAFAQRCLVNAKAIYRGFTEAGILRMNETQLEALTLNAWIILTSWVRFLCTTLDLDGDLSEAQLRRGIYQVLALESGHIEAQAQDAVDRISERLYVPL